MNEETRQGMSMEDFEQRLRRQPLRQVPSEWREEILVAAGMSRRKESVRELTFAAVLKTRLRELLWPNPRAWAGLAAIWVVIVAVNFGTRDKSPVVASKAPPPSPEVITELRLQRRLLAELIGSRETQSAEQPKLFQPQPRGELSNEILMA